MWDIKFEQDPLCRFLSDNECPYSVIENLHLSSLKKIDDKKSSSTSCEFSTLVKAKIELSSFFFVCLGDDENQSKTSHELSHENCYKSFLEGGRTSKVAIADLIARTIVKLAPFSSSNSTNKCFQNKTNDKEMDIPSTVLIQETFKLEPLHFMRSSAIDDDHDDDSFKKSKGIQRKYSQTKKRKKKIGRSMALTPFMLERSDIWCDDKNIHLSLRVIVHRTTVPSDTTDISKQPNNNNNHHNGDDGKKLDRPNHRDYSSSYFSSLLMKFVEDFLLNHVMNGMRGKILPHVSSAVFQQRLREKLLSSLDSVAFVADGSILPRKSGENSLPMSSPPAAPFLAPEDSPMSKEITISMGSLHKYLQHNYNHDEENPQCIKVRGLLVPSGITLITGGGYHGKSTLLRTIAAGVYNKIPGDGREFCVTVESAISVRAEDGRYVNNCNISAFISNLPTVKGVQPINTSLFSTNEASGSTSQATNVSEAIEMGASTLLVDEDVSAANFMSRDGRMRALVMDESITPLLYRVNGLYEKLKISCIVVVGGVGDWLDVPHNVIKLENYIVQDATKKARSISAQFSYGHVQYAGRGVVHRLKWENSGSPLQRRPSNSSMLQSLEVNLLDGGGRLYLSPSDDMIDNENMDSDSQFEDDDDAGIIDMTRCEQLLGKNWQLYGCGMCVSWLMTMAFKNPKLSVQQLIHKLEMHMNESGGIAGINQSTSAQVDLIHTLGFIYRPRKYEVAMAVNRMRGIKLEPIPPDENDEEAAAAREAEERKRALLELWTNRRKGKTKN